MARGRITHVAMFTDRFYFATMPKVRESDDIHHIFSIDSEMQFRKFQDPAFQPLSLFWLFEYCRRIRKKLVTMPEKIIIHCSSDKDDNMRVTSAFLAASFAMLYLGMATVESVMDPLIYRNILPYSPIETFWINGEPFDLRLEDYLNAIFRARILVFFNFDHFNHRLEGHLYNGKFFGDIFWIVPEKFLVFGPPDVKLDDMSLLQPPRFLLEYLGAHEVKHIIRLCEPTYNANHFVESGFQHDDLYIVDGAAPSAEVVRKFFKITEKATGPIAVHCDARLGRTATMIAAYLIKHYSFITSEAVAWVRMCRCRPISDINLAWLTQNQLNLLYEGEEYRLGMYGESDLIQAHPRGLYQHTAEILDRLAEPIQRYYNSPQKYDDAVNAIRFDLEDENNDKDNSEIVPLNASKKEDILLLERCDHFNSPEMHQLETMLGALACCNSVQFEGRLKYYNLLIKCDDWGYEFHCNLESVCDVLGKYGFDLRADEIIKIIESLRRPPPGSLVPRIPAQIARRPLNTLERILRGISLLVNSKRKTGRLNREDHSIL